MASEPLSDLLPDLVLLIRRDGRVLSCGGGRSVPELRSDGEAGHTSEPAWSDKTANMVRQLVRRTIAQRASEEATFTQRSRRYEVRVTAQGPDRAVAVIRAALEGLPEAPTVIAGEQPRPELDRRGFLRRFKESLSMATLRESSLAVAVLYIDGISDVAQVIGTRVAEQIMSTAVRRLSTQASEASGSQPPWYLGQLGENVLAVVLESSDRDAVEACVAQVCASLREPIAIGDAEFRLTPYAGVGVLGLDASSPRLLLDHARAASAEARRAASDSVFFFSDTTKLRSLARLDMARELREAIANRDIRFRYTGRHDLLTGRLVTSVGYLRWLHPLRGEIRPAEFLRVAESTGLGVALSRAALESLCDDYLAMSPGWEADVRISFGALRDHIFHEQFHGDMQRLCKEGRLPPDRLELRISEKAFVARDASVFAPFHKLGMHLVVDEAGRGTSSVPALARAPVWGVQLDRMWTTAARKDDVARKICLATASLASSLGLAAIATGVDDTAQRDALLEMGYRYGTGDLYTSVLSNITEPAAAAGTA
jgi:predicted signal transduction protein with EAL and GGDEF domain